MNRITVTAAALLVNRSPRWIQKLIQRGDIRAEVIEIGKRKIYLVDVNEVRGAIVAASERGAGAPKGNQNWKGKSQETK